VPSVRENLDQVLKNIEIIKQERIRRSSCFASYISCQHRSINVEEEIEDYSCAFRQVVLSAERTFNSVFVPVVRGVSFSFCIAQAA